MFSAFWQVNKYSLRRRSFEIFPENWTRCFCLKFINRTELFRILVKMVFYDFLYIFMSYCDLLNASLIFLIEISVFIYYWIKKMECEVETHKNLVFKETQKYPGYKNELRVMRTCYFILHSLLHGKCYTVKDLSNRRLHQ